MVAMMSELFPRLRPEQPTSIGCKEGMTRSAAPSHSVERRANVAVPISAKNPPSFHDYVTKWGTFRSWHIVADGRCSERRCTLYRVRAGKSLTFQISSGSPRVCRPSPSPTRPPSRMTNEGRFNTAFAVLVDKIRLRANRPADAYFGELNPAALASAFRAASPGPGTSGDHQLGVVTTRERGFN